MSVWSGRFHGATYDYPEQGRPRERVVWRVHESKGPIFDHWAYYEREKPFTALCLFVDALERNVRAWQ